jgi:hypothetical protein
MPRDLPPATTVTPDDLWIIVTGSPRKPIPYSSSTSPTERWAVTPSRTDARNLARSASQFAGTKVRAMPLLDFLARRYAP